MRPYFPDCRVESDAGQMGRPILGRYGEAALMPRDKIQQVLVRDLNAFGFAG